MSGGRIEGDDAADAALRRDQLRQRGEMPVGIGGEQGEIRGGQATCRDLGGHVGGMVDHGIGAEGKAPITRGLARRRGDDGEAGQELRDLDRHRADPARTADHKQRLAQWGICRAGLRQGEPLEERFPHSQSRQRNGGSGGGGKCFGAPGNERCLDHMQFRIPARSRQIARIEHRIAGFEPGCIAARLDNGARNIPAEHLKPAVVSFAHPHPCVGGVDPNGLDADQQIARPWLRGGNIVVDQRLGRICGEGSPQSDGFHGCFLFPCLRRKIF